METIYQYFRETSTWLVLLLIWALYAGSQYVAQEFIYTDSFYFNSFSDQMAYERIQEMMKFQDKFAWLNYVFIPIMIFVKVFLVSICLMIGALLVDLKISFAHLFRMVLKVDIVFALSAFFLSFILAFFMEINSTADLQNTDFYSLLAFFNMAELEKWVIYPLKTVNFFQVLYWLGLTAGLMAIAQKKFRDMLKLVSGSYGMGLLIWIAFIVFLQLNWS